MKLTVPKLDRQRLALVLATSVWWIATPAQPVAADATPVPASKPETARAPEQRPVQPSDRGRRPVDPETDEYFREPTARDDLDQRLPAEFMPPAAQPEALANREGSATAAAEEPAASILFDNGSLDSCEACGAGGAGESQLRDLTSDRKTLGFGHQQSAGGRIADDFTIEDPAGWTLRDIHFFAYQTGSTTQSPITSVDLKIWSGPPGLLESRVVWDGGEAHRLIESRWTGLYRVSESSSGATNRPIMDNTVAVNTTLEPGTYWLDWQMAGRLHSGPWAPSFDGAGDALQSLDGGATWQPALDPGSAEPVGFPFVIEGDSGMASTGPAIHVTATPLSASEFYSADPFFAEAGTEFVYVYGISNTGDTTLTLHDLVDDQFGVIKDDFPLPLQPGSNTSVQSNPVILNVTTANTATWTAFNPGPIDTATDQDSATVYISTKNPLWCNSHVSFGGSIPSDWTVINNLAGSPVVWTSVAACGEAGNYVGKTEAACASSDLQGAGNGGLYDTSLITPPFSLVGVETAALWFRANYQNFAGEDRLDLDISTNNGSTWVNLLSWNEDHGNFRAHDFDAPTIDLTPYAGEPHLLLRWRYHDQVGSLDVDGLYAQIDDVELRCTLPAGGIYECRQPNLVIPDYDGSGAGLFDDLVLDSSLGTLYDLDVRLRVTHDWVGDLTGFLLLDQGGPGHITKLFDRPGAPITDPTADGCRNDDIHAIIDDEGTDGTVETTCESTSPAISGALIGGDPANTATLSHFDGLTAGGVWSLNLVDNAAGDAGTLEEWCLIGTACGRSVTNRIFFNTEIIEDCGTLTVGPFVRVKGDLTLRSATGVVFNNGVVVEDEYSSLTVEIDPSMAPP